MLNPPPNKALNNNALVWQETLTERIASANSEVMIYSHQLSEITLRLPCFAEKISQEATHSPQSFQILVDQRNNATFEAHPLIDLANAIPHRIRIQNTLLSQPSTHKGFIIIDRTAGTWLEPLTKASHKDWMRPHHTAYMGHWFQQLWDEIDKQEDARLQAQLWITQLNEYFTQASRSIMILSHGLKEEWLRLPSALETLFEEARRGRRKIQLLIKQSGSTYDRTHPIVRLLSRAPTLINVKTPPPAHTTTHNSFIIIDDNIGTWLTPLNQSACTNWMRPNQAKQLSDWYKHTWDLGTKATLTGR